MPFAKSRGIGLGLALVCGLLAACAPSANDRAGDEPPAERSRDTATAEARGANREVVTSKPERSALPARASSKPSALPTGDAEAKAASAARAKAKQHAGFAGMKRAQLARPTDFAKLTAELKRKQALAAGLDEAAVRAELEKRALAGDAEAALTLGLMLRYGEVTSGGAVTTAGNVLRVEVMDSGPDGDLVRVSNSAAVPAPEQFAEAERLIAAAADAGNARAMAELGRLFLTDETRADGPAQAEAWLRKAWAAGESEGAFLLASAQRLKLLEPAAEESTDALLLAAAEQGNEAARRLAMDLGWKKEMPPLGADTVERWLAALAESGELSDMVAYGTWLMGGGNPVEGQAWLERAAANGSIQAIDSLLRLDPAAVGNPRTREALIAHLEVLAADSEADSASANFLLAQYVALRGDGGAAGTEEVLAHLKAAASRYNCHAGLAAIWIESGRDVGEVLAEVRAMDDATAYARYVQASREPSDESPGTSSAPVPLVTPRPEYPVELRAAGTTGVVTVAFIVDETGKVWDPQIVSSDHPALSAAVLEAISRWSFRPGMKDGVAVATRTQVMIPFKLRE